MCVRITKEGRDNPEIRVEQITKAIELALSLLSMSFGYGTKKYSFENGQIKTATEYFGERQDAMQELGKQRQVATEYIQDICRAVMWFSNKYHDTAYNLDAEITTLLPEWLSELECHSYLEKLRRKI